MENVNAMPAELPAESGVIRKKDLPFREEYSTEEGIRKRLMAFGREEYILSFRIGGEDGCERTV